METRALDSERFPDAPWSNEALETPEFAFAALWASGADTALDHVFRMQALRRGADGGWERFDRFCRGVEGGEASARMAREFGVTARDLEGAASPQSVWEELTRFLGAACVVVPSKETFVAWSQHFSAGGAGAFAPLGLDELAALLLPVRGARAELTSSCAVDEVVRALAEVVQRFRGLPEDARSLAAAAWAAAWSKLSESDPFLATKLARALSIVDRPSAWASASGDLFAAQDALEDGALSKALRCEPADGAEFVRNQVDAMKPRWATVGDMWRSYETVPVRSDEAAPLSDEDLARVDDVFQVHLPATFAAGAGKPSYRKGQHDVARQVARVLGSRKLLLVHAPTGTGKTLSYLVPSLLWSLRNNVRVAVSTYTRALQEQAVEQELPRALSALAHAGVNETPRVTVLKGRANYLCWRALRLNVPAEGDSGESWLAWTSAMLFAWLDDDGDLDHFPMRAPLMRAPLASDARGSLQREIESLVRTVRASIGCCRTREDRDTCAAEVSRQRAERSHVLVTNHAFALIRQTFFRHVVFDECEHLHDQAGGAWSWTVTLREVREFLTRLRQPGRPNSRAPFDRLERLIFEGDPAWSPLESCRTAWFSALGALDALQVAVDGFKRWREQEQRTRAARDQHSLLRDFVSAIDPARESTADPRLVAGARALVTAHRELCTAAAELDAGTSQLAALLDGPVGSQLRRLRRQLELARGDLSEWLEAVQNFLPTQDGRPVFATERFYDVEQDSRGDDLLAARVLLPNEILGRSYYPALDCAVLISATTWLRGGFETSVGYLGLDRAMQPLEGEEREPSVVETFRAEDPFDYGRVLVCVPNDAPDLSRSRESFQSYVRRFVAHLGERTRGRMLVLFTASDEARRTGEELTGFFRARGIPLWFQNMSGVRKEELGALFRARVDSCLFGVDTFWYGADFPGETLEYLVIVKLPYGVPDRYYHAQCAALGSSEQRRRIYLPRALAKFRQGFGRLMRRESDRGCVFVLDVRVLIGAHKLYLGELPLASDLGRAPDAEWSSSGSQLVVDSTDRCLHAAFAHMDMLADIRRRGLDTPFTERGLGGASASSGPILVRERPPVEMLDIAPDDVPF